jgi:integrase
MSKPLYIPPSKKFPGLHVQCTTCNEFIDQGMCKKTGKSVLSGGCPHPEKHVFKAVLYLAKKKNKRKTKILQSRTYETAIKELLDFKERLKDAELTETIEAIESLHEKEQEKEKIEETKPTIKLLPAMARYVGYLHGDPEIVPVFKRKERSKAHVADVERTFLRFVTAINENDDDEEKIDTRKVEDLSIDDINDDEIISEFYEYLIDELELGNAGYNRALTNLTSFYQYLIDEGYTQRNPFKTLVRKPVGKNVETIEPEQFDALIEIIQKPELGIRTLSNGVRKNYWRPFLPDGLKLILFSGKRRTEAVLMRWKDAFYKNDILQYIKVPDYKVNKQKNLEKKDWIYHYAPATEELRDLLKALGEDQYRNSDKYILAPDEQMSRSTMASLLSKAFAHYAEQLGIDLTLGSLRRTNFSSLAAAIGLENAQTVSGHAGLAVLKKHYIDKKVLIQAATHNVFDRSKDKSRQSELNAHREENKDISIER